MLALAHALASQRAFDSSPMSYRPDAAAVHGRGGIVAPGAPGAAWHAPALPESTGPTRACGSIALLFTGVVVMGGVALLASTTHADALSPLSPLSPFPPPPPPTVVRASPPPPPPPPASRSPARREDQRQGRGRGRRPSRRARRIESLRRELEREMRESVRDARHAR